MPNMWVGVVGTFVLSLILASGFLWLRCRGVGPPFGPHARWWALLIGVATAIVSAGVGMLVAAVSHNLSAAYIGLVVPGWLWFSRIPPLSLRPTTLGAWLTLPLSRLYDAMGEDMQAWCDIRHRVASEKPQWIADAAKYYYDQVRGRLKDRRALAELYDWRDSIVHKIGIVRLIDSDTTPGRLGDSLQKHPSTGNLRRYADEDLLRLARRLESDATNELYLFLASVYRLGYYRLPVYPSKPPDLTRTKHAVRVLSAQSANR
jgi:hypothetical protein